MTLSCVARLGLLLETEGPKMVAISGFSVLVWDHIVTFDDEVGALEKVLCFYSSD